MWVQALLNKDDGDTLSTNQQSSELFSLGTQPVIMVSTNTATYQIPVEWKPVSEAVISTVQHNIL